MDPTGHVTETPYDRELAKRVERGEISQARAIQLAFTERAAPLIEKKRYEKSWGRVFAEQSVVEFGNRTVPLDMFEGLANQNGKQFVIGTIETVIAAAIPTVVKEGAGALVARVPVLGRDVGELGAEALAKGKAAVETAVSKAKGLLKGPVGGNTLEPALGAGEPLPAIPGTAGGTRPIAGGSQGADALEGTGGTGAQEPATTAGASEPSPPVKDLRRPYVRKPVRQQVDQVAPRTAEGKPIDPNTFEPIEGKPDLGHKAGREFRRERAKAKAEGLDQKKFNDRMNDPDLYQLEDPSSNRSHKHEKPGND